MTWSPTWPAWGVTVASGSDGWSTGAGTLSSDNSTALLRLDNGIVLSGTVSAGCTTITWNNTSLWKKVVPPTVITDVHIIAYVVCRVASLAVAGETERA